ncbi:hypothetical protein C8256_19660 [Kluyvera genomosp. 2]|uniref:Uncharacterized protein n=1 Tax=Kluyvera genomosp. 2 TaxID=2774054 RepID=A0A2T2XY02_9ENTR|nr:hypothetical protein C8256_19660 [Kluyvera genomosp. 2]
MLVPFLVGEKQGGERSPPNDIIVVLVAVPLNAHFCVCLAHFSIWLENYVNDGHNDCVGKGIWSPR